MTTVFVSAVAKSAPLLAKAAALCIQPAATPEPPFVFDKNSSSSKAELPGSIVRLTDGTYFSVPFKPKAATFGQAPKLFGRPDGALQGSAGSVELDTNNIASIAMGILSDPSDTNVRGHHSSLTVHSLSAVLKPVVAVPFAELFLEISGGSSVRKSIDEGLQLCGIRWRAFGRAAAVTTLLADGLPLVAAARAATLTADEAVGPTSAFTPARRAALEQIGLLTLAGGGGTGGGTGVGAAGGSAPVAIVGDLADFLANACSQPGLADAAAGALAAVALGVHGTGASAAATHAAARAAGVELLEALRGVLDSLDTQSIQWMVAQRAALVRTGAVIGGAQLGALATRAAAGAAAAAAAVASTAPAAAPSPAGLTPEAIAIQVAAILRTQAGLAGGAPAGGAAPSPYSPIPIQPFSPQPPSALGAGQPTPGFPLGIPSPPSPYPSLDAISFEAVTDEATAVGAITELGNGDAQRVCDALAKLEAEVSSAPVSFNFGSALSLPIEEQLIDFEARLAAMAAALPSGPAMLSMARPPSWVESRQRLGRLMTAYAKTGCQTLSAPAGAHAAGAARASGESSTDAAARKPPSETFCSPKAAGASERPFGVAAKVLDAAMGDFHVLADAAAPGCAEHGDECARLRAVFPSSAGPYLISNGSISGTSTGKRGEGKLPIRLERAREGTRDRVLAELTDAVTAFRIDDVRSAVEACAERVACLDFRLPELVRFLGGNEPGSAIALVGSAGSGRFGSVEGGTREADLLAAADIRTAAPRIDVLLDIVLVDTLGRAPLGRESLSRFVAQASAQLDLPRLKRAIEGFFGKLRTAAIHYRSTVGAEAPDAAAALLWARTEYVLPLAFQQAGADAAATAAAEAAEAAVAQARADGRFSRRQDAKPREEPAPKQDKRELRSKRPRDADPDPTVKGGAKQPGDAKQPGSALKKTRWGPPVVINVDEKEAKDRGASSSGQPPGDKPADPINKLGRGEGGAGALWEQLLGEGFPSLQAQDRPCFWHFAVKSRGGASSACQPSVRGLAECDRSHAALSGPMRASLSGYLTKIRAACSSGCRGGLLEQPN